MGKIPDRWLPYRALGKIIKGTRFVAFKVPLSEKLSKGLAASERFTPDTLLATCPKLSLVVDLTNTDRYYDKREFTSKSVQYEKIHVPGKECPSSDLVLRFFEIVDKFIESEDDTDSLIGVHCTHGVNRTGYFICRYMIQRLGFDPMSAIQAFQDGRGYPIERENYKKDLIDHLKKKPGHIEEGNVKANKPCRAEGKSNLYISGNTRTYTLHRNTNAKNFHRSAETNSSHWNGNTDRSYRTIEPTDSCRESNTGTSWRNESRCTTGKSYGNGYVNKRNHQEKKKYEQTSPLEGGRAAFVSDCWGHSDVNHKVNSQGGRKHGHKSSNTNHMEAHGSNYYDVYGNKANYSWNAGSRTDESDDWRRNNPYTQRKVGGSVVYRNDEPSLTTQY